VSSRASGAWGVFEGGGGSRAASGSLCPSGSVSAGGLSVRPSVSPCALVCVASSLGAFSWACWGAAAFLHAQCTSISLRLPTAFPCGSEAAWDMPRPSTHQRCRELGTGACRGCAEPTRLQLSPALTRGQAVTTMADSALGHLTPGDAVRLGVSAVRTLPTAVQQPGREAA